MRFALLAVAAANVLSECETCVSAGGRFCGRSRECRTSGVCPGYCGPQHCDSTTTDCPLLMTVLPKIDQCQKEPDYFACMKNEGPKYVEMIGPSHIARAYVQAGKLNGRAYYRSPDGEVLYYYPEEDYWVVSVKLGGLSAKAYAPAGTTENPIDATEWFVYTDGVFAREPMARVVKAGAEAVKKASGVPEAPKRSAAFGATVKDGPIGVVPKDGSGTFSPFGRRPPDGPVGG